MDENLATKAEEREALKRALENPNGFDFETLAAQMRRITSGRELIPSEVLLREMRDER